MNKFEGYLTRQAYPFDLIFFNVPEKYRTKFHERIIGVQTDWRRYTNPELYAESERKPTNDELILYATEAAELVHNGIVKVIDGESYRGLMHHGHKITLNNYKVIDVTSKNNPDLYFEISKMIRSSTNGKFGHPYELDELTDLLIKENLI